MITQGGLVISGANTTDSKVFWSGEVPCGGIAVDRVRNKSKIGNVCSGKRGSAGGCVFWHGGSA